LKQILKNRNRQNDHINMEKRRIGGGFTAKRILPAAAFLLAGSAFLYMGVVRGEMDVVLRKAINICLECIGIG